jgi:hypothetical protein
MNVTIKVGGRRSTHWVPAVGDRVRRSDSTMGGTVVRVTHHGGDARKGKLLVLSDGASTHHVRVLWDSGSESAVPNARLVPAS